MMSTTMESNTLALIISISGLFLTIAGILGFYAAYKGGQARASRDFQTDAITALQAETAVLKSQVDRLVTENKRQIIVQNLIIETLGKKFGLLITIEKTSITIFDQSSRAQNVVYIQEETK